MESGYHVYSYKSRYDCCFNKFEVCWLSYMKISCMHVFLLNCLWCLNGMREELLEFLLRLN